MTLIADRPGPGTARPYRFPQVIHRDGVVAAHLPGQPLAVAVLLLDAGACREPAGR
jgi:zinc protease